MGITPAERLGLTVELLDDSVFQTYWDLRETGNKHVTRDHVAESLVGQAASLAWQYYLTGDWKEFADWSQNVIECTVHFFLGDFRKDCPDYFSWTWQLEDGLGWGSVGELWDQISKVLTYPFASLQQDDKGKSAKAFHVGLARWWKDRSDVDWMHDLKEIRGAGSKYYHLLGDVVGSIAEQDNERLNKNLEKCIKQYYESERGDFEFPMAAVFLRNLAVREGMNVSVPDDIDKYLFHLPDNG